jgi:hypothetical protein
MITWKEKYLVPNIETTHVVDGYEDICGNCEKWGEACESCDISVPITTDEFIVEEKTMTILTCCGIPIGHPYEVKSNE